MAYRAAIWLSRNQKCSTYRRISNNCVLLNEHIPTIYQVRKTHDGSRGEDDDQHQNSGKWTPLLTCGAGIGMAAAALAIASPSKTIQAEEDKEKKITEKETLSHNLKSFRTCLLDIYVV